MNETSMTNYYGQRAAEYEAIYAKPERQTDLVALSGLLQGVFQGKNLLEIACGTGYWTQIIAQTAAGIYATDINEAVLQIAREKNYALKNVQFERADMYALQPAPAFEALFGGFIWSHIHREALNRFIDHVHSLVLPGSLVVFADNRYVEGSSTPIAETDAYGNTYQKRSLKDGSMHTVLKNFPTPEEISTRLAGKARSIQCTELPYFWMCAYQTM